jgi:predicted nucleic acid-binding protein
VSAVLLDTGPLVAYFDRSEAHHGWATEQFAAIKPPLLTCEPVLTEAAYLIQSGGGDVRALYSFLRDGVIQIPFQLGTEAEAVAALMRRYADLPMDLADACLVRMTEVRNIARVFTLDEHFTIYRRHGRQIIPLIIPIRR